MKRHDVELAVEQMVRNENDFDAIDQSHPGLIERLIRAAVVKGARVARVQTRLEEQELELDLHEYRAARRGEYRETRIQRRLERSVRADVAVAGLGEYIFACIVSAVIRALLLWLTTDNNLSIAARLESQS